MICRRNALLLPFDQDWYEDKEYWVHYKFVDKPRRKPKMKVVYGGAVTEAIKKEVGNSQ